MIHRRCARARLAILLVTPLSAHAIVNGVPVEGARYAAEFGWAIALESPGSGGVCTAALISPTWIVTAAHCASADLRVRVGSPNRGQGSEASIVEAIRHPRYDENTGAYDVGLIRLRVALDVTPVRLATPGDAATLLKPGALAVIAGWGKRSPRLPFSEELIVSDVELRSLVRDGSQLRYFDPVSGPCGGDSGGPLLLAHPNGGRVLAGVASRVVGDICAQGGGVGFYADIAAVRDFIEMHVEDLSR